MTDTYAPASDFLTHIAAGTAPLSDGEFGDANLRLLMLMTRDGDRANRDWAVFLLAQADIDSAAVRDTLLCAAMDEDDCVRAEAICGLAKRGHEAALPLVHAALAGESVAVPIFEAAAMLADPSLVAALTRWCNASGDAYLDDRASDALATCKSGKNAAGP